MKNQLGLLTAVLLVALTTTATATIRYVDLNCTNATPPFTNWPTAATNIQDAVDASTDGDEVVVTNGVYASGGRAVYGTMTNRVAIGRRLLVRSVNGPLVTVIAGKSGGGTLNNGNSAIRCVYLGNNAVLSGFTLTNGHTRMAGDDYKERCGGGVWCEVSGVITNCILTDNSAIFGGGGVYSDSAWTGSRLLYSGTLNNCTLTGNSSSWSGGGAYQSTLNNCALNGNLAWNYGGGAFRCSLNNCTLITNSAYDGGGAYYGSLTNCTLTGNSASYYGGGANQATLNNCTLAGNSAYWGGGNAYGIIYNCIVYYNYAPNGPNCYAFSPPVLYHSCTTPLPSGLGNIADEPLFVDTNGWSNLRLQSNSPCVNAGNNAYVTNSTDLDGNPRIAGGTADMGAYEFQGTGLSGYTGWLWQHGLRVDGTADDTDSDGDTANNRREWVADTDPTNALSVLKMLSPTGAESGVTVSWQSVNTRSYFLERATNLGVQPPFQILQSNIVGQVGTTIYTDTNASGNGPFLYRVGVQQ